MICRRKRAWLGTIFVLVAASRAAAVELTVEKTDRGAVVKADGQLFAEYLTLSGQKPIVWPIIGPTGKPMTRSYPMVADPDETEKRDHPHHRSLWFTHGIVGDADFWDESDKPNRGTTVHQEFLELGKVGENVVIATRNDWIRGDKKVCEDERRLTFGADAERRWIDFDIKIKATAGPLTIGETKEGTFGVRVAGTMKVDSKLGGQIVNSQGQKDTEAWGKPAAWVDYHGPVDGEQLGIAILNHPSSFRYPTHWHVRTYGLFAANPFGLKTFGEKESGAHRLESGESLTLRYRVLLHKGDEKIGQVSEAFEEYRNLK